MACLIDKTLPCPDDFFKDSGIDFRPILSQLVSSELDADRMDYLERDSYFCGTNYGKIDKGWLVQNLTFHKKDDKMFLALNRRALYAFDDFLISHHPDFSCVSLRVRIMSDQVEASTHSGPPNFAQLTLPFSR